MPVALITGGSRGLGRALAREFTSRGWDLIVDARHRRTLEQAAAEWDGPGSVIALPGDVADAPHRRDLGDAVLRAGRLDLLVNNASTLGPSPQPSLEGYSLPALERVLAVNVLAPLAIFQTVLPQLVATNGVVVNVTSDAAVGAYEGWGGYGSSKAALDQMTAILAIEQPGLSVYAFDPGDMRTVMHQEAFPEDDISDRPEPETVVPAFLRLLEDRPPSGRYRVSDLRVPAGDAA